MKYLRKFDSHEAFTSKYTEIKDQEYCVSAVQDMCGKKDTEEPEVRVYFKDSNFNAWAGDLLCWDTAAKKWVIQNVEHNVDTALTLPSNLVPDAVCVVPACHTEDGKARWCALNDAKNDALKPGGNSDIHYFKWANIANSENLIDEFGYCTTFPQMQSVTNDDGSMHFVNEIYYATENQVEDLHDAYLLPMIIPETYLDVLMPAFYINYGWLDPTTGVQFTIDGFDSKYKCCRPQNTVYFNFFPPVYGPDLKSKNSVAFTWYQNTYSDSHSIFNEIDGKRNTEILLKLSPTGTEYPAALAASLYEQTYSSAGTWYLPAICELIYLCNQWYTIQHTLYRLQQGSYSASPLSCDDNVFYWSSTQYNEGYAVNLRTANGTAGNDHKYYTYGVVRPFRSF